MCLDNVSIFMRKHLCLLIDDIRSLYMHICQNIEWKLADQVFRRTNDRWSPNVLEWRPRLGKRSVGQMIFSKGWDILRS